MTGCEILSYCVHLFFSFASLADSVSLEGFIKIPALTREE